MSSYVSFLAGIFVVAAIGQAHSYIPTRMSSLAGVNRRQSLDHTLQHEERLPLLPVSQESKKTDSEEKSFEQRWAYNNGNLQQHSENQHQMDFKAFQHHEHYQQDVSSEHPTQGPYQRTQFHLETKSSESKEIHLPTTTTPAVTTTTEHLTTQTTQSTTALRLEELTATVTPASAIVSTTPVIVKAGHSHSAASRLQGFSGVTSILVGTFFVTKFMWL